MTQGCDRCQPDCAPNVHLMHWPTKVAILSPLISDDFDVINLAPYTIIADCVPNVHLMHWPTKVATTPCHTFTTDIDIR